MQSPVSFEQEKDEEDFALLIDLALESGLSVKKEKSEDFDSSIELAFDSDLPSPRLCAVGRMRRGSLDGLGVLVIMVSLLIVLAFQTPVRGVSSRGNDAQTMLKLKEMIVGSDVSDDESEEEVRFPFVGIFMCVTVTRFSLCLGLCGRQVGKIKSCVSRMMFVCVSRVANARFCLLDSRRLLLRLSWTRRFRMPATSMRNVLRSTNERLGP